MCKLDPVQVELLVSALRNWSLKEPRVEGLALVGSWAEGRTHAEADVDFICVVAEPDKFRGDTSWMGAVDWKSAGLETGHWSDCDYGSACSRHLTFDNGAEIEVSFVPPTWTATNPVDPTTRRVASDGLRVVHDPSGCLGRLLAVL